MIAASVIGSALVVAFIPTCVAQDGYCEGRNAEMSCCHDGGGVVLPIFPDEASWNKNLRACLYLLGLMYCFIGVSVLSDAFMAGIERITNSTYRKTVLVKDGTGSTVLDKKGRPQTEEVDELRWNPTVANLTLMALGSSTPEILLSIIEIAGAGWFSGDLGPGTVVGSASFNLYMITAFCMVALPVGVTRKIENTTVFLITAFHSLAAYIWMTVVLLYISPDVVELWEALVTLGACPWLVFIAYCADKNWFRGPRQVYPSPPAIADETTVPPSGLQSVISPETAARRPPIRQDSTLSLCVSCDGRRAAVRRAVAAIISVRTMGRHAMGVSARSTGSTMPDDWTEDQLETAERVYSFSSSKYAVHRGSSSASLCVVRVGTSPQPSFVKFKTIDDTAVGGVAFEAAAEGKLRFGTCPAAQIQSLGVPLLARAASQCAGLKFRVQLTVPEGSSFKLGAISEAEVTLTDRPEGEGELAWAQPEMPAVSSLSESETVTIERRLGWKGAATVQVRSVDCSAEAGTHYEAVAYAVHFGEGEVAKTIEVRPLPFPEPVEGSPRVVRFFLEMSTEDDSEAEPAIRQEQRRLEVRVRWDRAQVIGLRQTSWPSQLRDAFAIADVATHHDAGWGALALHLVSLWWKVLAAAVPPPHYCGGWACFGVGLALIGVLTMLINDLASIFGCLVGLRDQVTAITIVALGTSLPDTFASVLAIRSDDNADNAIGNITGSNSINVFLGLGLPWTAAAIIWGQAGATEAWVDRYREWTRLAEYRESGAFVVIGGSLGFNTMLFTILTMVAFSLLGLRRSLLGCEIGGPRLQAWLSAGLLVSLWLVYVVVSSLEIYHPDTISLNLGYQRG